MMNVFPTPVLDFDFSENPNIEKFNENVVNYILECEQHDKNAPRYSLGGDNGYHSRDNLTDLKFDWSRQLKSLIFSAGNMWLTESGYPDVHPLQCEVKCWAMVIRKGCYSDIHTHPGSMVSGVYYPKVPEMKRGEGQLVIPDPRGGARGDRLMGSQKLMLNPKQSCGFCFPGWLDHFVTPYQGDDVRISIAFNIIKIELPLRA